MLKVYDIRHKHLIYLIRITVRKEVSMTIDIQTIVVLQLLINSPFVQRTSIYQII